MEYLDGGSLRELIKNMYKKGNRILPSVASQIIKLILEAVAYLHSLDTAHRDLKPGT